MIEHFVEHKFLMLRIFTKRAAIIMHRPVHIHIPSLCQIGKICSRWSLSVIFSCVICSIRCHKSPADPISISAHFALQSFSLNVRRSSLCIEIFVTQEMSVLSRNK